MSDTEGSEAGKQEPPSGISVKISPVRRLCRMDSSEDLKAADESQVESVVACPSVLRQLSGQLRAPTRGVRGGGRALPSLATVRSRLVSRPYWRRCLCSPAEVPTISERELAPLLALTPAHRFIVLVVTNTNADSLGSVVVGGESLLQAVYATQNVAGLRPCLQSPSEPSLAFIKYDLARPRGRRRDKKASSAQTPPQRGSPQDRDGSGQCGFRGGGPEASRGFWGVSRGFRGFQKLPEASGGFRGLPEASRGFLGLPEASGGCQRLPGFLMILIIYQKTRMLYSGFPLASYGCRMQDFLGFISKHTQYNFKLRAAGYPDGSLSAPSRHGDVSDVGT
nr:uncharacterized protein LOC113811699 [Penaeus vannamei]